MPSSKLREVTNSSGRGTTSSGRRSVNVFSENPIVTGPRSSRNKKKLVEVNTSDDDDLEEDEEVGDSEDAPGEEDDNMDADGDVDMDDTSPQPPTSKRQNKPATPAKGKPVKGVEAKEMELAGDDDDDEELSELDSDAEGEPDETGIDETGEGGGEDDEELDEEDDEDEEDEEDENDSDEATPATGSRGSTPDLSRLTKRQRGSLGSDYLQLPMEPQVKKHLTAEEYAMRRAEMARRRKNLSEKRNEEEKMDTINRLLKKQAPKRRGRVPAAEQAEATPDVPQEPQKPNPTMIRWVSSRDSCKVAVPEELIGTPAARVFGEAPSNNNNGSRKLVEEV
ncbi:hypothetical protein VTN77DRAFT_5650 [Rasamsonia byssochlamydoides]|uniref:uncharacterized protein n=1 Tax=Rasamsonia byssochlamydoides TaxID=89139 RepID=UPI003742C9BC